ncbi:MAG: hypothetical protein OES26_23840 [Gammaproteobacteria bacterium]|nr:hypothetical protein [Gammaproteobacteria bacterium]
MSIFLQNIVEIADLQLFPEYGRNFSTAHDVDALSSAIATLAAGDFAENRRRRY